MPAINSFISSRKRPQNGFGLIEITLVIIVVGVLSATGWYAWRSKAQTDKILNNANADSKSTASSSKNGIFYSVSVPSDFKTQLQAFYSDFKPTCALVRPGPIVFNVTKIVGNAQLMVSQTCGGVGGSHIYVDQNGKLIDAAVSAGTYACTDVDQYKISSQLAANCYVSNWDGSQTLRANTNP